MRSFRFVFYSLLIIAATGALWLWLDATQPEVVTESKNEPPMQVELVPVKAADIQMQTRITGRLQPARRVSLKFEVAGQVLERNIETGQKVRSGQALMALDSSDFKNALRDAQTQLQEEEKAIARDRELLDLIVQQRKLLERDVARQVKLGKQSLVSKSKTDEMQRQLLAERSQETELRYRVNTASQRMTTRQLAFDKAQLNLERATLKAPFEATVNKIAVEVGDYATIGQVVIELVEVDELNLQVDVASEFIVGLKAGKQVKVQVKETTITGEVIAFQPDPDPMTYTHELRIRLMKTLVSHHQLIPGQLAEVVLDGRAVANALTVPITAVLRENSQNSVFRFSQDHLEKIPVRLEGRFEDKLLIHSDNDSKRISAGDQIVMRYVEVLEDGQRVSPQNDLSSRAALNPDPQSITK